MTKSKQLIANMIASLVSCLVGLGISFYLSPYIIDNIGYEANGFITLSTSFVSYASIAAMALNSMAGRFITVKIYQNDNEGANQYFNSVMIANIVIVLVLLVPCILVVRYLDSLINISPSLVLDVKLLFAAMFINFMITVIGTSYSTATFAANRLDLSAMRTIESNLLKAVLLIAAFALLPAKVTYVGIVTCICTLYILITNIHYTKKLLPQIQFKKQYFHIQKVWEIVSAGVWNTVMRTGQTLTNGLDVLIANLWISEYAMGLMAVAKIIASAINSMYETIAAVFTPSLTISYAKEKKEELLADLTSAMKMTGFFANIPLCFIVAFGMAFYNLWLPGAKGTSNPEDIRLIYQMTILTMYGTIVGGAISPLFNVYTVVNKLKMNSLITLLMGILNVLIVYILLQTTDLGIYAVVGVSTVLGIIKNLTFTPMYAAYCLNISKKSFYPTIIRYVAVSLLITVVFFGLNAVLPGNTWLWILIDIVICGIVGSIINLLFLFGKRERTMLADTVFRRYHNV